MKTPVSVAAILVAVLLGGVVGYGWASRGSGVVPVATVASPVHADAPITERKVLYWHDPMKPEVKFDKPGKSPFMDMQLEPVYADEASAAGTVAINAATQQNLGLRVGRVAREAVARRITAVGAVGYDEHAIEVVQARASGYVTRLIVKAPLDRVRRGQALAEVVVPAWLEAESEYLQLLDASSASGTLRDAARRRLAVLGLPELAIQALDKTRVVPQVTTLYAPLDGVVTELGIRQGASFAEGTVLFRINGLATVWVNAQIPETQAGDIVLGARVETRAKAWPDAVFMGHVEALLPQVDATTRTLSARLAIDNSDGRLTPGMFVETSFQLAAAAPQLWVPSEALIVTGERSVVIVKRDDDSFDVANVTVGAETNGKTAILSGVQEGQQVVLSGQFLIDSEASLKATSNRMGATFTPELPGATP